MRQVTYIFAGDAAKLIGVHRTTINRWLHSGELDGWQRGNGHWLVSLDSVNERREYYGLPFLSNEEFSYYWETGET